MAKDKLIINKIPLKEFIDLLINLYQESNVDFIDLIGEAESETQDALRVGIRPEYINRDGEEDDYEEKSTNNVAKLSKEDFENLI